MMDQIKVMKIERKDHKNKDEGVTANTDKIIFSGKEKSSREKEGRMLDKRRNKQNCSKQGKNRAEKGDAQKNGSPGTTV